MAKTKINKEGYRIFLDSGKLVHRWVAEKKYGKEECKGKEVHHIDLDKKNNESNNLLLVSKQDHYRLHQHENKVKVLSKFIFLLSLTYFAFLILFSTGVIPLDRTFILWGCVMIIMVLAFELMTNIFAELVRRPNE
jgi:hypothetical protein